MKTKVAIYARYSTDKQDQSSITGQTRNCEAFAKSKGWQIVERYTDEAIPLWSTHADIPYERMWEDDIFWLPRMLAGENFNGRFAFADDAMQGHTLDFFPTGSPIENRGLDIIG